MDNNLQKLYKATDSMTREERESFENYFLGAMSSLCDTKTWDEAIKTAEILVRRRNARLLKDKAVQS